MIQKRLFATASSATEGSTGSTLTFGRLERKLAAVAATKWLRTEGKRFRLQPAAKFVGPQGTPFPMNPLFKPQPPVSNATRQQIYDAFVADPTANSPLKLARQFSLSIVRIQAILRLKALEKHLETSGQPVQVQLTHHMEKLLRVDPAGHKRIVEPLRALESERLKPLFHFIDDADAISPLDAAALLEKEPYANVQHKLDLQAERIFSMDGPDAKNPQNAQTVEIERDPSNTSRFKFSFVDITDVEKRPMFIRDGKGTLRSASKLEIYKKKTAKPAFFM